MDFNLFNTTKKPSLKNSIILILAKEWPLRAGEVFYKISRKKEISRQAVHRALDEMNELSLLTKKSKHYELNQEWLKAVNDFSEKTLKKYETYSEKRLGITRKNNQPKTIGKINFLV